MSTKEDLRMELRTKARTPATDSLIPAGIEVPDQSNNQADKSQEESNSNVNDNQPLASSSTSQPETSPLQGSTGSTSVNESIEGKGNDSAVLMVAQATNQPVAPKRKRYKKERLVDTHEQKSYYMEKEIVSIIDELAGDDTGFKYRFVNDGVRLLIETDYPELAHRLRKVDN